MAKPKKTPTKKTPNKGKLYSIRKLSAEYDITFRRLNRACKKAKITIIKARVNTDGGPQIADAVYMSEVKPILDSLQMNGVTTADVTAHEAAAKLGVSVRRIKSAAVRANVSMVKKLGTEKRGAYQPVDCMTKKGFDTLKASFKKVLVAEG